MQQQFSLYIKRKAWESFWNVFGCEVADRVVLMQFFLLNISAAPSTLYSVKEYLEVTSCVCACA